MVRASDFGPRGPWFEPRPVHISSWIECYHLKGNSLTGRLNAILKHCYMQSRT